jgi:hypothetical protein
MTGDVGLPGEMVIELRNAIAKMVPSAEDVADGAVVPVGLFGKCIGIYDYAAGAVILADACCRYVARVQRCEATLPTKVTGNGYSVTLDPISPMVAEIFAGLGFARNGDRFDWMRRC